jgi:hypothetical protein
VEQSSTADDDQVSLPRRSVDDGFDVVPGDRL